VTAPAGLVATGLQSVPLPLRSIFKAAGFGLASVQKRSRRVRPSGAAGVTTLSPEGATGKLSPETEGVFGESPPELVERTR